MKFLGICLPWGKVLKLKLEFLGISHYIVRDGSLFKCLETEVGSTSIEIVTLKLVFLPLNFQESLVTFSVKPVLKENHCVKHKTCVTYKRAILRII